MQSITRKDLFDSKQLSVVDYLFNLTIMCLEKRVNSASCQVDQT